MKKLRLFTLFSLLCLTSNFIFAADNNYLYDCSYQSAPLVIFTLKNGKQDCPARICIADAKCSSNVADVKVRASCSAVKENNKWKCPGADDCVADNSIEISKGLTAKNINKKSSTIQNTNTISK